MEPCLQCSAWHEDAFGLKQQSKEISLIKPSLKFHFKFINNIKCSFSCRSNKHCTVRSISTFGNAQNNTLTSQHGGFKFSRGDSSRIFNSHFSSSLLSLLCPLFINTTTKKTLKKRHAQDCGIWRWNTTFDTHDNYAWLRDRLVILKLLYLW